MELFPRDGVLYATPYNERRPIDVIRTKKRIVPDPKTQVILLSAEDQHAFVEAVLNPPPLTAAMERAIERHRTIIAASR